MNKDEINAMVEAHRQAAWRAGWLCGFAWTALGVVIAAAIYSSFVVITDKSHTKIEKKK